MLCLLSFHFPPQGSSMANLEWSEPVTVKSIVVDEESLVCFQMSNPHDDQKNDYVQIDGKFDVEDPVMVFSVILGGRFKSFMVRKLGQWHHSSSNPSDLPEGVSVCPQMFLKSSLTEYRASTSISIIVACDDSPAGSLIAVLLKNKEHNEVTSVRWARMDMNAG